MTDQPSVERWVRCLLWIMGGSIVLALVPIWIPLAWMESIHRWLGLGSIPEQPIFSYLARSLSAMYFAHGVFVLAVSTDVQRYWPLIRLIAMMNVFLGCTFVVIDWWSTMPWYWTAFEGPPIAAVGLLLWILWSRKSPAADGTS